MYYFFIQWRHLEFSPHDEVVFEDGVLEVGELGIALKLDGDVFIVLAFIANAGFA
ncbi:hypothetical protein [Pseudomonas sp. AK106]